MRVSLLAVVLLSMLALNTTVSAQDKVKVIEDVILFQSEAHLVRMTEEGKIIEFIKSVGKNYNTLNTIGGKVSDMDAVAAANARDLGRSEKSLLPESEAVVAIEEGDLMENAVAENVVEKEDDMTMKSGEEKKGEEVESDMIIQEEEEEDERETNYDYEFAFSPRDAALSPTVVNQLNQVVEIMKNDADAEAEIETQFSEEVDISKVLSERRAKGIQDQLVAQGIERSRIKISEVNSKDWSNNRVKLSIN